MEPGSIASEKLRHWINEWVEAKFQCVSGVVIMEDFPRNVAGKIFKREMCEPYWEVKDIRF